MGAEFLAMILIVVYVGAVAVLFLFVVMMLDVDFAELRRGVLSYLPIGVCRRRAPGRASHDCRRLGDRARRYQGNHRADTAAERYSQYAGARSFPAIRLFLPGRRRHSLVAMIGAIVLTLHHKPNVRRQIIAEQVGAIKRLRSRSSR